MRLRNMLKICLVFWKSEPQYAYKLHAYKKKTCMPLDRRTKEIKAIESLVNSSLM